MEQAYNDALADCLKVLEAYCIEFGYPRKYDVLTRRIEDLKFGAAVPVGDLTSL